MVWGGGLSDVKWDRRCFCFKCVTWVHFVWYFWCVMISNCKLFRRVCMKRWLEMDRIDWLCMSSIWLYGVSVRSIEWQQFEMNISRSLSVGISFLNFSKSFKVQVWFVSWLNHCALTAKNVGFYLLPWYNQDKCRG